MSTAPDIFLSYSRDDAVTARRFAEGLQAQGFSVWWDATLSAGESYDQVTEKALNEAKAVVVLWSRKSVNSRWVRAEATEADRNKTLVPVMIEPCKRPIMFELTHTADLAHWKGDSNDKAWQPFVANLRKFVQRGAPDRLAAPSNGRTQGTAAAIPWYRSRNGVMALVALPLLIIAALLYAFLGPTGTRTAIHDSTGSKAATSVSLAVLPFVNMSRDPDQEYFSDGLSEELLNQLAQIKDLQVAGRTSSFSFKGKNEDLRVIGEKLGVNHLLEGSVRRSGDSLRITAQLISAASGTHLWSRTYDRKMNDIFKVQEEIARDVATALSITLDVGDTSRANGGTTSVEAYDKYLRANTLRDQIGPKEFTQANQLYREAVAIDPKFSRAWSELYSSLAYSIVFSPEKAEAALTEMAEVSAQLIRLSPNAWWTQSIRMIQAIHEYRWSDAEAAARAVQSSAPASEVAAARSRSWLLANLGRIKEAAELATRLRDIDPLSLGVSGTVQSTLTSAGSPDEAQQEYQRSRDFPGDHAALDWFALLRVWARANADPGLVQAQYRRYLQHESLPMEIFHTMVDKLDNKQAARVAIRKAFDDPASQDATRMYIVTMWADHFGDKDLALAAMRRALIDMHFSDVSNLWLPYETGLRSDPRFKQMLRDLKLADYFRASGQWGDFCHPVGTDDFECR